MKFNQKLPILFLDPHSDYEEISSNVNIILSPSLYWVKKMLLPVKYVREVKKLLPSIFEDILPEGKYNYFAYKQEDEYIVFAYSDKLIMDTLAEKGIPISSVANIYFAQSEITGIEGALTINKNQSIYIKDDILVLLPCSWVEESADLDLADIQLSKRSIALEKFGHIVETKSLYKIGAILMMMIFIVAVEYFITAHKTATVEANKDDLFQVYNLKSTTFQNKALLKKYKAIHKKQTKIRDIFSKILSIKLQKDVKISFIGLKNKKFIVNFTGIKEGSENQLIKSLQSKKLVFKKSFTKKIMKIEVSL